MKNEFGRNTWGRKGVVNQRDPDNNNQPIISDEIKAVLDAAVKATYK